MSKSTEAQPQKKLSPLLSAIVGGLAGAFEISLAYPFEFSKVVQQLYPEQAKKSPITVLAEVLKRDGPLGWYKGYPLLLMGGVPKAYVRFGVFDYVLKHLHDDSLKSKVFAGFWAGFFEAFVHIPLENMKIKIIHD